MRYTDSMDGTMRANVRIVLRLDKEQFAKARQIAKVRGEDTKTVLSAVAILAVDRELDDYPLDGIINFTEEVR